MVFQEGRSVAVNSTSGLVKIVPKLQNNPDLSKRIMQAAIEATSDFELEDNKWYVVLQVSGAYLRISILVVQMHRAAGVCCLNTLLQ
ncbi:hypothetical protein B0H14DRAFT_3484457 [Mycena olivaceomarginata]|nr:hypothetical protein B0H14DRAFT_3484457 [Mycena olivaceomarginata]